MLFYLVITLIVDAVFIGINFAINGLVYDLSATYIILAVLLGTIIVFLFDFVIFGIIYILPNKWFKKDLDFYKANEHKKMVYQKLGIKKKDWVSMGEGILTLKKKAFWAHIFATVLGFLIILIVFPIDYWFLFSAPIGLMNFVLNGIPIIAIRYNF